MACYEEFGVFGVDDLDLDVDDVGPVEMRVIEEIEYEEEVLNVTGCVRDWGTLRDLYGADAAPEFGEYMEVVGF